MNKIEVIAACEVVLNK